MPRKWIPDLLRAKKNTWDSAGRRCAFYYDEETFVSVRSRPRAAGWERQSSPDSDQTAAFEDTDTLTLCGSAISVQWCLSYTLLSSIHAVYFWETSFNISTHFSFACVLTRLNGITLKSTIMASHLVIGPLLMSKRCVYSFTLFLFSIFFDNKNVALHLAVLSDAFSSFLALRRLFRCIRGTQRMNCWSSQSLERFSLIQ